MTVNLSKQQILPVAALLATALLVSGCGRKGDFDTPKPAAADVTTQPGDPVQPKKRTVSDRPFFLDPLL